MSRMRKWHNLGAVRNSHDTLVVGSWGAFSFINVQDRSSRTNPIHGISRYDGGVASCFSQEYSGRFKNKLLGEQGVALGLLMADHIGFFVVYLPYRVPTTINTTL